MYLRKWTFRLTVFLFALGLCANSFSQARYHYLQHITVKSGMGPEFVSYMKKFVEAAKKLGDVQPWTTVMTTTGGQIGQYTIVIPHENWEERDSWTSPYQMLVKAFGEEEAAKIMRVRRTVVAEAHTAERYLLPESTTTGTEPLATNYLITRTVVKPGHGRAFRLALSKIWKSVENVPGAPKISLRGTAEGDRRVYVTASGFENGAERDKRPNFFEHMSKMYSDEEIDQILETIGKATIESHRYEVRVRPDLSNQP